MTQLLQQVVKAAEKLPDSEQDWLASRMLEEIESEQRWDELFANSRDALAKLSAAALAEHRAGRTTEFDPDREI